MKGGLFEWRYYFWLIPLDIAVVVILIAPKPLETSDLARWTVLSLIAHAIMAIPFGLLKGRWWVTKSLNREIAALVIVGLVRGFAILDFGLLMNLPQAEPYLLRPLNSSVVVPTWFVIIHFLVGSRRDFAEDYRVLYIKIIREKLERLDGSKSKLSIAEIEARIEGTLAPLRAKIETLHGSKISPARLAEEAMVIQSHVEGKIRPLSHELWQKREVRVPSLGQLRLFSITVLKTRLPIGATILPATIFSIMGFVSIMDLSDALVHQLISSILVAMIFVIYRLAFSRTRKRAITNLSAFLGIIFLPQVGGFLLSEFAGFPTVPLIAQLVGILWFFFLLISFGAAIAVSEYHAEIMLILRQQLEKVMIPSDTSESEEIASRFARYLHGEVQSELLSASMILNEAARSKDTRLGRKGIEKTAEVLRRTHSQYAVGSNIAPEAKIQKIVDAWAGIADIEIQIQEDVSIDLVNFLHLSEVIEELVSNSVRHAGSTTIHIQVNQEDGNAQIIFTDNGKGFSPGKPGMGSSLLQSRIKVLNSKSSKTGNILTFELL
jgi:signal transduction histidine kinase